MLFQEKDLLWDELNLNSLLTSSKTPSFADELAIEELKNHKTKSNVERGHQKMLNKPAYSVLMDRYQSLPHKPKTVQMSKITRLADPVRGRYTNFEKYVSESTPLNTGKSDFSITSPIRVSNQTNKTNSHKKPLPGSRSQSAFFLTGEDDDDDYEEEYSPPRHRVDHESTVETNKILARNGFASVLRNRVEEANRIEQLQVPLKLNDSSQKFNKFVSSKSQAVLNKERLAKAVAVVGAGRRKPIKKTDKSTEQSTMKSNVRKKEWHENTAIHHIRGTTNKKPISQVVSGASNKSRKLTKSGSVGQLEKNERNVVSSGYGGKPVQRTARDRILKKITSSTVPELTRTTTSTNNHIEPPPSHAVSSLAARRLRSKSTIDILETIEETRRRKDTSTLSDMSGKRTGKSGTRSAPLGSSGRSASSTEDRGGVVKVNKTGGNNNVSIVSPKRSGAAVNNNTSSSEVRKGMPMSSLSSGKLGKNASRSKEPVHPNSYLATQHSQGNSSSTASSNVILHQTVAPKLKPTISTNFEGDTYGSSNANLASPSLKMNSGYFISNDVLAGDFHSSGISSSEVSPSRAVSSKVVNISQQNNKGVYNQQHEDPVRQSEREYADIQSSIAKLKQYDTSTNSDSYNSKYSNREESKSIKKDVNVNAMLAKKAIKLGSQFSDADDILSRYRNLANSLN